jgi:hypothetical protein
LRDSRHDLPIPRKGIKGLYRHVVIEGLLLHLLPFLLLELFLIFLIMFGNLLRQWSLVVTLVVLRSILTINFMKKLILRRFWGWCGFFSRLCWRQHLASRDRNVEGKVIIRLSLAELIDVFRAPKFLTQVVIHYFDGLSQHKHPNRESLGGSLTSSRRPQF